MDNTWVKLYRKIGDHEILDDANGLKVFVWLLTRVDKKTGKYKISRFRTAEILKMNPSTFRDTIYRLRDKYKIIDTKSDNQYTEIILSNWAKYNSYETTTTSETTARRQRDDTKQEYNKNIQEEYIYTVKHFLKDYVHYWNLVFNTKYQTTDHLEENMTYWLKYYTDDQIYQAVKKIPDHEYWKDKMNPTLFLRQSNPRKEKVDYIGEMLNLKKKNGLSEDYRIIKA